MFYEHCTSCAYSHSDYECKRKIYIKEDKAIVQEVNRKKEVLGHKLIWLFAKKMPECTKHSQSEISIEEAVHMDKKGFHPEDNEFFEDLQPLFKKQWVSLEKKYRKYVQTEIESLKEPTLAQIQRIRVNANMKLLAKLEEMGNIIQSSK